MRVPYNHYVVNADVRLSGNPFGPFLEGVQIFGRPAMLKRLVTLVEQFPSIKIRTTGVDGNSRKNS